MEARLATHDTTTYEYDRDKLKPWGAAAQAALLDDPEAFSGGQELLNSHMTFLSTVQWLKRTNSPDRMGALAYVMQASASMRTHPRHVMDASRLLSVAASNFCDELEALAMSFNAGISLDVSDEVRSLAAAAVKTIDIDRELDNLADIEEWADNLSKDLLKLND